MLNLIGKKIGRYLVTRELGEGGMAVVYHATDKVLDRQVAIKVLRASKQHSGVFLDRFEREAKSLAKLTHPNIVPLIDYGQKDDIFYLVMPYLEGGTLKDKLERAALYAEVPEGAQTVPVPWKEALRTLLPVARALNYAHRSGIIHRDVKPSNILITETGDLMLTDFGLAKLVRSEGVSRLTKTGAGLGTPDYMAPEQLQGDLVDPKADIYSLGIVLYEMMTGHMPFEAESSVALAVMRLVKDAPPPSVHTDKIPPAVELVLMNALARDPHDRFRDMAEFIAAIEELLQNEGSTEVVNLPPDEKGAVLAAGDRAVQSLRDLPLPWMLVLSVVVVLAFACSLLGMWYFGNRGPQDPTPVPSMGLPSVDNPIRTPVPLPVKTAQPTSPATIPVETQLIIPPSAGAEVIALENISRLASLAVRGKGDLRAIDISPDGKLLSIASPLGITLYDYDTMTVLHFLETTASPSAVVFSPDSASLAAVTVDGSLMLWQTADGSQLRTMPGNYVGENCLAVSPDGQWLAAGGSENLIRVWRAADGSLVGEFEGHGGQVLSLAFSPDGKQLVSGSEDTTIRLWDVLSGKNTLVISDHSKAVNSITFSADGSLLASGSDDQTIKLWKMPGGNLSVTIDSSQDEIRQIAFSPDGSMLASRSDDPQIQLWNVDERNMDTYGTLTQVLDGHTRAARGMAFAPGGDTLASGSLDGYLRLWQLAYGGQVQLEDHNTGVYSLAVSPDGQWMASGADDGVLRVWRAAQGPASAYKELVAEYEAHPSRVTSLAFSPDSALLASGSLDDTIKLWRVEQMGLDEPQALVSTLVGGAGNVNSLAFSPDGTLLASGASDGQVRLWYALESDSATFGIQKSSFSTKNPAVSRVVFSPACADAERVCVLAAGSGEDTIELFDLGDSSLRATLNGLPESITVSPNGQLLAVATGDRRIELWDITGGQILEGAVPLYRIEASSHLLKALVFSPQCEAAEGDSGAFEMGQACLLAGAFGNGDLKLWRLSEERIELVGSLAQVFSGHTDEASVVVFSPDGSLLLSGSWDQTVRAWRVADSQVRLELDDFLYWEGGLDISPQGDQLAAVVSDGSVWLMSPDGAVQQQLAGQSGRFTHLDFSPNCEPEAPPQVVESGDCLLVTGSTDHLLYVWDYRQGLQTDVLTGHSQAVSSLAIMPECQSQDCLMASAAQDGSILLWHLAEGTLRQELQGNDMEVTSLAFSADQDLLASGSTEGTIRLWRISDGNLVREIAVQSGAIHQIAFSPDSALLASGSEDQALHVWRIPSGGMALELEQEAAVLGVQFSQDSSLLVSGSADNALRVWNAGDGVLLHTLMDHRGGPLDLEFWPGGSLLVSSSQDGSLRFWGIPAE